LLLVVKNETINGVQMFNTIRPQIVWPDDVKNLVMVLDINSMLVSSNAVPMLSMAQSTCPIVDLNIKVTFETIFSGQTKGECNFPV
jgi:hypothetical protein